MNAFASKRCGSCGKSLPSSISVGDFCPHCDAYFGGTYAVSVGERRPDIKVKPTPLWLIAGILVILLGVLVGGIFWLTRPASIDTLLEDLRSDDQVVQRKAAWEIHERIDEMSQEQATSAVVPLAAILDSGGVCHEDVAELLGEIGDPRAVESLARSLIGYGALRTFHCEEARRALARIGGEEVVTELVGCLRPSSNPLRPRACNVQARVRAIHVLGDMATGAYDQPQNTGAVPPLIEALADPSERVRWAAVLSFGRSGDERAATRLERMRNDPDRAVRQLVQQELDRLSGVE